jgi:hypothetical protein
MKNNFQQYLIFYLTLLLFNSCKGQTQNEKRQNKHITTSREGYELADSFLNILKVEKADTILFNKRTCIGCCDFYNFFWTKNGKHYLQKFYFDFEDMKTHSVFVNLKNSQSLIELGENYEELKSALVKENVHKRKDGSITQSSVDHYCYNNVSIYVLKDSIIRENIKDTYFGEFATYFSMDTTIAKERNDNYLENKNSKWNLLLNKIEMEIQAMRETTNREFEKRNR